MTAQGSVSPLPSTLAQERSSPPTLPPVMVTQHLGTLVLAIQNGITPCYQQRGSLTLFLSLAVHSHRLAFLFMQRILSSPITCSNFLFPNRQDLCTECCDGGRAARPHHQAASRWGPFSCSSVRKKGMLPLFLPSELNRWSHLCGILLFYFATPLLL